MHLMCMSTASSGLLGLKQGQCLLEARYLGMLVKGPRNRKAIVPVASGLGERPRFRLAGREPPKMGWNRETNLGVQKGDIWTPDLI